MSGSGFTRCTTSWCRNRAAPDSDLCTHCEDGEQGQWDGVTVREGYRSEGPRDYETACINCGERSPTLKLTRRHAALMGVAGLPRCSNCRGFLLLERIDQGNVSGGVVHARRSLRHRIKIAS